MEITKNGVFCVVGRPNAGKSSLTNALTGEKVAIVSPKPQTTRSRITGILTKDDTQYVFVDTPGLLKPSNRLQSYMARQSMESISDVDAALLVVFPDKEPGRAERVLIDQLASRNIPIILVINKVDACVKEALLPLIKKYGELHEFEAMLPVSAKTGDGIDELFTLIKKFLKEGSALFSEDIYTDQTERKMICEILREKLLFLMHEEIPHGIAVEVETFKYREDGLVDLDIAIFCEKPNHKGMIIGKQGAMLKEAGARARQDIERLLDTKVFMNLWVRVKDDWRDNEYMLREFGYED